MQQGRSSEITDEVDAIAAAAIVYANTRRDLWRRWIVSNAFLPCLFVQQRDCFRNSERWVVTGDRSQTAHEILREASAA